MTHERIQERLNEWLDGELDASASAEVSAHLESCGACRGEAARLRRLGPALFSAKPDFSRASNEAFTRAVMARVEAESVTPWERFAALFVAPALGLALAGLLFAIYSPRPDADAPLGVAMAVDTDSVMGVAP